MAQSTSEPEAGDDTPQQLLDSETARYEDGQRSDPDKRLGDLIEALSQADGGRRLGRALLDRHLALLREDFEPLMRGKEIEAPYDRVENIVALFYSTLTDSYIGIDSHLPSNFWKVHPFLLGHLEKSLEQFPPSSECHGRKVTRIVRRTMKQLRAEQRGKKALFGKYLRWHENRAKLLRAEPQTVASIQRNYDPAVWTTDVGLWPRTCALLFQKEISSSSKLKLQLYLRYNTERFNETIAYVKDVLEISNELFLDGAGRLRERDLTGSDREDLMWSLEAVFEAHLADRWAEFVDSDVRLERKERELIRFLLEDEAKRLTRPRTDLEVFDAAMGVGTESVMLLSDGYKVKSNEIDWTLISHAREYASRNEVEVDFTRYDWRHLAEKVTGATHDVVLCLGNSLTCLPSKEEMIRAVRGLRWVVKPGGVLIIDERNYRDMIARKDEMLSSEYRFSGEVIYCGEIKAKPLQILGPGEPALLGYYDGPDQIGKFTVYCYGEGEMEEILKAAGFEVEAMYWDLERAEAREAEFLTYVARRV